jgi:selenocysteine-specific elongation factor
LHHGTSRVPARISFLEDDGIGQLKLASPIFAFVGDRFVIRDPSERQTIGGGVVLDPDGERHLGLCSATDDIEACVRAEIARRHLVQTNDVLTKSHFSMSEIGAALNRLEQRNQIILRNGIAIEPGRWQKLRADAIKLIDDAHKRKPDRAGLDLSELNSVFPLEFVSAIVTDLCTNGFVRRGSAIARAHHHPALPISLRSAEKDVREALTERRFDPPARKEIEKDDESRQVIRFLIEIGEAIEIGSDVIVLRDNFEKMTSRVVEFISQNGPATVSQLREALQSSRRVIVPFLEKLDRDKITQRVGDKRVLAKKPDL